MLTAPLPAGPRRFGGRIVFRLVDLGAAGGVRSFSAEMSDPETEAFRAVATAVESQVGRGVGVERDLARERERERERE